MKTVYVVPYFTTYGVRYSMHYTKREARAFGFRQKAKTGENFHIHTMNEAQAMSLR